MRSGFNIRCEIVVVFAFWYDSQRILQIGLSGSFLGEPYFVEGLAGDAAREMCVKLETRVKMRFILVPWVVAKSGETRGTSKPQSSVEL